MKVSIITASFNSEDTIIDSINSVNNQSYHNIEHIFIDGKSSDNTLNLIKSNSILDNKIISEKDDGIYFAMNKGIELSSGDILGILNSDDFYVDNNVIEDVVTIFNNTNCDAVYADLNYVTYNKSKIIRKWKSGKYKKNSFKWGWMPPHPTLFVKKEIYNNHGLFDTNFKSAADYELMLRLIHKDEITIEYLPRLIVNMRTGGLSNSSIYHRFFANKEDQLAWKVNNINNYFFTRFLKPLRKIFQYI